MADLIQFRRDTAERWQRFNPVLAAGEVGFVLDETNQYKLGDGVHAWNELPLRGFNGNVVENLGDDYDAVMSQHGISRVLKFLINNDSSINLDSGWDVLDNINTPGFYVLVRGGAVPVHHMLVTTDYMYQQYNQWIFGNLLVNEDGSVNGTHTDGIATIVHRSRPTSADGIWSKWKYIQEYFIKEENGNNSHFVVSQKFFTETINTLQNEINTLKETINSLK